MGLNDILNMAQSALTAQSFGLQVTGQNVANVNTPGYARRVTVMGTRDLGGSSFPVATFQRVADQFVNQRHLSLTGLSSHAETRDQLLGSVEAMFNDFAGTGLMDDLNGLMSSFSAMAARPDDLTTRAVVLDRAEVFASRVNETSNRLSAMRVDLFTQARGMTRSINDKLDAIAELSGRINEAKSNGELPADLEDRRDALLVDLSKDVEIRTYTDGDGQLVVQGAGVTLIQSDVARRLEIDMGSGGALQVFALSASGGRSEVTSSLAGGSLAAVVDVRDTDLVQLQSDLDQFAFHLATEINTVHSGGFGLDGVGGRNLFSVGASAEGAAKALAVDASVAGEPSRVAAAGSAAAVPGDSANAQLLAQLADNSIAALGGRTPIESYAQLVGDIGALKANAARVFDTRQAMLDQVEVTRQSISGVSLDEEMVALTKYQRAFEAASRVLTTADQLLEDLINTLGR